MSFDVRPWLRCHNIYLSKPFGLDIAGLETYLYRNKTIILFATQFHRSSAVSGGLASFLSVEDSSSSFEPVVLITARPH